MLHKYIIKDKASQDSIRWRLHEPTRVEAFSDAVFAFALTLVVISLEVPQDFNELLHLMKGFFGFAICFIFIILIWHEQYIFFRRYGLQDTRTTFYNMLLLFMVIYLVYPLKFLFYALSQGFGNEVEVNGQHIHRFTSESQLCQLMIIYGFGYLIIYSVLALMHVHALKRKEDIRLSPLEVYNTKTFIIIKLGMLGIVLCSLCIALYGMYHHGSPFAFFSGMSYSLIGFVYWIVNSYRGKRLKKLFTKQDMDEVMNEVVIMEEKN